MSTTKLHNEFHAVDMASGWHTPPGYPAGVEQKILSGTLDEAARTGDRTRLLRFQPGAGTTAPIEHDYWEEVYVISGEMTVGFDENGNGGETHTVNTYACRPPHTLHGPFRSPGGCTLLEVHFYDEK